MLDIGLVWSIWTKMIERELFSIYGKQSLLVGIFSEPIGKSVVYLFIFVSKKLVRPVYKKFTEFWTRSFHNNAMEIIQGQEVGACLRIPKSGSMAAIEMSLIPYFSKETIRNSKTTYPKHKFPPKVATLNPVQAAIHQSYIPNKLRLNQ